MCRSKYDCTWHNGENCSYPDYANGQDEDGDCGNAENCDSFSDEDEEDDEDIEFDEEYNHYDE